MVKLFFGRDFLSLKMNPKVSICITTYNLENYIRECLDSALCQKVNFDFEIIIVDDASTDHTPDILKEYRVRHSGVIKLYFNSENLKYAETYRKALSLCTGEFIAVLDGDDCWTDTFKLQKQIDFLKEHQDFSMVFSNGLLGSDSSSAKIFDLNPRGISPVFLVNDLLDYHKIWNSSVMYRNLHQKFPAWVYSAAHPDYPLHVFHTLFGKAFFMNDITGLYRRHSTNLTSNKQAGTLIDYYEKALTTLMMMHSDPQLKKCSRILRMKIARQYQHLAWLEKTSKNWKRFFNYILNSLRLWPFRNSSEYKSIFYIMHTKDPCTY